MSTLRQIEANRRNSQKSTGPRSPEGKAHSRFNALKTGITAKSQVIPGEDPDELEALAAEYHGQLPPSNALERFLVDALVNADWQLRRLRRVEAQLWDTELSRARDSFNGLDERAPLGQIFARGPHAFNLLQRRIDSVERSYYRALKQLQLLHGPSASPDEDPPPAPDPDPPAPDPRPPAPSESPGELASFFQTPPPPAPTAPSESRPDPIPRMVVGG